MRNRFKRLTLEPVAGLVGEKGLAAGIACEAAILHAKSVELGELLAEHPARRTIHMCKTETEVQDGDRVKPN